VYVWRTVRNLTELGSVHLDTWCVCKLVQRIYVIDLPAVLRSVCYVGKRLACRELPNNPFMFPYCMVSIILVFSLQCRIHVYCLVCVTLRWNRVTGSYVLCVFFMSCCYWSSRLSCIWSVANVTFELIYIPLEFVLVLTILSVSCWCVMFVACRAIFKLECLKRLVIFRISGLWYENGTHF
jgi:hypothetical protein